MLPKDPAILLSYINLKLRDYYEDIEDLCKDLNVRRADIDLTLNQIDYSYDKKLNQYV